MMSTAELEGLLAAFVARPLSAELSARLSAYLELLLKWNERINLTAVRAPEQIVRRHFGESLFAAEKLLQEPVAEAFDLGTGAGFPGLPMAIYSPNTRFTLIESQNKKATFLKEAVRALALGNVTVFSDRGERLGKTAELVTMRAVERFAQTMPLAAAMVAKGGRLGLLIGRSQVATAQEELPQWRWKQHEVPESDSRMLLVGGA